MSKEELLELSGEVIEKLHQLGLDLQPNPEGVDDLELI